MYDTTDEANLKVLERKGILFKNMTIKNGQFVDLGDRLKRNKRPKQEVEQVVRKQKRAMIQNDIRRQKKERARAAQAAKRNGEEN